MNSTTWTIEIESQTGDEISEEEVWALLDSHPYMGIKCIDTGMHLLAAGALRRVQENLVSALEIAHMGWTRFDPESPPPAGHYILAHKSGLVFADEIKAGDEITQVTHYMQWPEPPKEIDP